MCEFCFGHGPVLYYDPGASSLDPVVFSHYSGDAPAEYEGIGGECAQASASAYCLKDRSLLTNYKKDEERWRLPMEKKQKKACIFDLDGTLVNTLSSIAYFANEALIRSGYRALPVDTYRGGGKFRRRSEPGSAPRSQASSAP